MALGKPMAEFSFKAITARYTSGPGRAMSSEINFEGELTGNMAGPAQGTLTTVVAEPNAKNGTWSWSGMTYLANGDIVGATSQGTLETVGSHKWRLLGQATFSDGSTAAVEGEGDLATRSLAGTLYEWS